MAETNDDVALTQRIEELERENAKLRETAETARAAAAEAHPAKKPGRARSVVAAITLVLAVVLAPLAAVSTTVRAQLIDTDHFVTTMAPLADDPAVQEFLSDQVMAAIETQVDFKEIVDDLADGLNSLNLPPAAGTAITLLKVPAAQGMRSAVDTAVTKAIESDAFASAWQLVLANGHKAGVAAMQGRFDGLLSIKDGMLTLEGGQLVKAVSVELEDRGVGLARLIPEVSVPIELVPADDILAARTGYNLAAATGSWLPWAVFGLLIVGVATARRRSRALAITGLGLFAGMLLLLGGLSIGGTMFEQAVSPSLMSVDAADAILTQLTGTFKSAVTALAFACALIAFGAFMMGGTRVAKASRSLLGTGFAKARSGLERHGFNTGGFGRALERSCSAVMIVIAAAGVLLVFLVRPVSVGSVVWTVVGVLVALALVELLRKSEDSAADPASEASAESDETAAATSEPADSEASVK